MKCPNCSGSIIIKESNGKKYALCGNCKKLYDFDKLAAIENKYNTSDDNSGTSKIIITVLASLLVIVVITIAALIGIPEEQSSAPVKKTENKTDSSVSAKTKSRKTPSAEPTADNSPEGNENVPTEYKSALNSAVTYDSIMHMSKTGLFNQLTSEYGDQFSPEAAQYAIDHIEADWNANALNHAQNYCDTMYMSKIGIYNQLISEYGDQFTPEEAQYAVDHVRANWNTNALQKAKVYQNEMNMSPAAIRDQLVSEYGEQFTSEEADYAISNLN